MTLEATSMVANLQPTVAGVVAVLVQCFLTHRAGTVEFCLLHLIFTRIKLTFF